MKDTKSLTKLLDNSVAHLFRFLCLAPILELALFYGNVLYVYLMIGRWPSIYNPKPTTIHFPFALILIDGLMYVLLVAVPLVMVLTVSFFDTLKAKMRINPIVWLIIFLIGFIAWRKIVHADPGQFIDWYFD